MTKRIHLTEQSRFGLPDTHVELDDELAEKVIKEGAGELSADQVVYNHEDEMPADVKALSSKARAAADAAGDYRAVGARSAATAAVTDKKGGKTAA